MDNRSVAKGKHSLLLPPLSGPDAASTRRLRRRSYRPATVVLAAVGLALLGAGLTNGNAALMAAGQGAIIIGLFGLRGASEGDPLTPRVVFAATFVLSYTWQILLVDGVEDRFLKPYGLAEAMKKELGPAVLLSTLGAIAFFCGDSAAARLAGDCSRERWSRLEMKLGPGARLRALLLFWTGVMLTVALVYLAGGLSSHVNLLSDRLRAGEGRGYQFLGPSLMVFATAALVISRGGSMLGLGTRLMIVISFFAVLLSGSKTIIGLLIVTLLLIFHWTSRPLRIARVGIFVLVVVFGLSMYNVVFRDAIPRSVPISQSLAERGGPVGLISDGFVGNTFFGLQALMIAHNRFPTEEGYLGPYSLQATLMAPVPRALYEQKLDSIARPFTESFLPSLYASGTSIPPTWMGEGYISYGPIGVAAYCFALAILCGLLHRRRFSSPLSLFLACIFIGSLLFVLRGELLSTTVLLASGALVGWVVLGSPMKRQGSASSTARSRGSSQSQAGP